MFAFAKNQLHFKTTYVTTRDLAADLHCTTSKHNALFTGEIIIKVVNVHQCLLFYMYVDDTLIPVAGWLILDMAFSSIILFITLHLWRELSQFRRFPFFKEIIEFPSSQENLPLPICSTQEKKKYCCTFFSVPFLCFINAINFQSSK